MDACAFSTTRFCASLRYLNCVRCVRVVSQGYNDIITTSSVNFPIRQKNKNLFLLMKDAIIDGFETRPRVRVWHQNTRPKAAAHNNGAAWRPAVRIVESARCCGVVRRDQASQGSAPSVAV